MSIWEEQVEPVLRAIAESERSPDDFLILGQGAGAEALGVELSDAEIHRAIMLLADEDYVEARFGSDLGSAAIITKLSVTPRGAQVLGEWPRFELLTTPSTLAQMLEQLAAQVGSEDDKGAVRQAAGYVRGLSKESVRTAVVRAGVMLMRQQFGLG